MKIKPLSKFTNKTGIRCFMTPHVPNTVGFYAVGVKQPCVEFMDKHGKHFSFADVQTNNSEEGIEKCLRDLNAKIEQDGFVFAPMYSSFGMSRPDNKYRVVGDVTLTNIFGDKFLHVGKGKATVYVDNETPKPTKIKLSQGTRVFLSHQDSDFGVEVKEKYEGHETHWLLTPQENIPLIDYSPVFIIRGEGVTARIKLKHWQQLENGNYLATCKAKVKLIVDGERVHEQHVPAGTIFHDSEIYHTEDGKLFVDVPQSHVLLTRDYAKIDYAIVSNLNYVVAKKNNKKEKLREKTNKKAKKRAKKLAKKQAKAEKKSEFVIKEC